MTIAERHLKRKNEHKLIAAKAAAGAQWFISQAIYNPEPTIDVRPHPPCVCTAGYCVGRPRGSRKASLVELLCERSATFRDWSVRFVYHTVLCHTVVCPAGRAKCSHALPQTPSSHASPHSTGLALERASPKRAERVLTGGQTVGGAKQVRRVLGAQATYKTEKRRDA